MKNGLVSMVIGVGLGAVLWLAEAHSADTAPSWRTLAAGIELGVFPAPGGTGTMQVVRVDPRKHALKLCSVPGSGGALLTAEEWARQQRLCLVVNAGMYEKDGVTHCGHLKNHDVVNPAAFRSDYSSICVFAPLRQGLPAFRLLDTDDAGVERGILSQYGVAIQNLRLIKSPGENRWKPQPRQWSEVALGQDRQGNALFIFCRAPATMHDFNEHLLKLPIHLASAQHLEGGPPASFYLNCGGVVIRATGGYESGFDETGQNVKFWQLPHVIGVAAP